MKTQTSQAIAKESYTSKTVNIIEGNEYTVSIVTEKFDHNIDMFPNGFERIVGFIYNNILFSTNHFKIIY